MSANTGAPVDGRFTSRAPIDLRARDLPRFWLTTTREWAHLTMWLHGELDLAFNEQLFSEACARFAAGRVSGVTVDLGGLNFLSVTGIDTLIAVQRLAQQRHIPFALQNVPARIGRLFGICGAARSFPTRSHRWFPTPRRSDLSDAG